MPRENTSAADASANHFTAAEVNFILTAIQNAEGGTLKASLLLPVPFDADAVAQQLGMKDGKTARARWNTIARTKINNIPAGGIDKTAPAKKNTEPKKADGEGERFIIPAPYAGGEGMLTSALDAQKAAPKKRGRKPKQEKNEEASEDGGVKVKAEGEEELP
ncbi:hypothetical protein DOTSEDRAFT_35665 [Dothistroma septosporum NZE10]|uniref:Myb-like domain-containing protein n=1 Tax=Dothistroma septosporum (strain NZE10 / CBS 128990) TaxID=675120 RepID=M2YP53_DOTSN|nr:hypothetical protein DOTSEDRAFT_35665 [Dothistroma septosporum NZE10]